MIELLERSTIPPKWMLYVGNEDNGYLVVRKKLNIKRFKNTKTSYFGSKGRLIGIHYLGSYSNLKRLVGKFGAIRVIRYKPKGSI